MIFTGLMTLLPEILLISVACLIFILEPFLPRSLKKQIAYFALAGVGLSALSLIPLWGRHQTAFSGLILLDPYAFFFKVLFLVLTSLVILISMRYLQIERINLGEYYGLVLFAAAGMMWLPASGDMISIYLSLELMSIAFYVLAAFMRKDPKSMEAGIKYFLTGVFTSGIILYGIALLYGLTGSTHLGTIRAYLSGHPVSTQLALAIVLLVAGFGFKIAATPFHMWAPDVYQGAPTPVSAFLSTGSKIAVFAAMIRVFVSGISTHETWPLFWGVAVLTMTLGNLVALTQTHLKRLLAYSSIAQTGYLLIGLVVPTREGLSAILLYSVAYTFMTLGAFTVVVLLSREQIRGEHIDDLAGLAHTHPLVAASLVLYALSLVGIPPTGGFIGKLFLFKAALLKEFYILAVVGVLNTAISLYYYFKLVKAMYMERPREGVSLAISPHVSVGLAVMSGVTLLMGIYPEPFIQAAVQSVRVFD